MDEWYRLSAGREAVARSVASECSEACLVDLVEGDDSECGIAGTQPQALVNVSKMESDTAVNPSLVESP
ncbi:MAG: hypothetical protein ACPG4T_04705 [Nannocystaceae bacterium]